MKYWIGAALGSYGIYLLNAARAHRDRITVARTEAVRRSQPIERPVDPNSVAALGEMVAPIVLFALAWLTLKICFAYYMLNTAGQLSPLDLAGTLLLIGGYGYWLRSKTNFRMPSDSAEFVAVDDARQPAFGAERPSPIRALLPKRPVMTSASGRDAQLTFARESSL